MGGWPRSYKKVLVGVAFGAATIASCSQPSDELTAATTSTTVETATTASSTTSTTSTTEPTTTTLSERAKQQLAEQQAITDIEDLLQTWYTYDYDSSKGEEGIGGQYLTGLYRERLLALAETKTEAGQIQRTRGNDRIEAREITVDLEAGVAEAEVCITRDHETVDIETGEVLKADDPDQIPGVGRYIVVLTDDGWKLSDWFFPGNSEFEACEFSS